MAEEGLLDGARNAVLVGGTDTRNSHLAAAVLRGRIRNGGRGRFFDTLNLVNLLEVEVWDGRPAPVPSAEPTLQAHARDHYDQPVVLGVTVRVRRREDDCGLARPSHAPLRSRRGRERELAFPAALERLTRPVSRATHFSPWRG